MDDNENKQISPRLHGANEVPVIAQIYYPYEVTELAQLKYALFAHANRA